MTGYLPYDPGILPTKKGPNPGDQITINVNGLPPQKKRWISLRNPKNPRYDAFVSLRNAATKAMNGRAWYFGPIGIDFIFYVKEYFTVDEYISYVGGIADTLCGGCGVHFTYLPIVYEDDCQICESNMKQIVSNSQGYSLLIKF